MAGGVAGAGNANGGNVFDVYGLGVDYQRTLDSEFKFEDLERKVNGELNIGELRFDSSDGKIHTVNSHDFWTILNHKKPSVGENAATRSAIKKLLDDKFGTQDELRDVLAEISERLIGGTNARKPISRDEVRVMINLLKHEQNGMTGGRILSREQVRAQLDISERLKTSGPAVRRAWENLNGPTIANYIKGWGRSSVLNDVSDNVRTSLKGERTVNDPKVALKNFFFEEKRVSNSDESTINEIFTEALLHGGPDDRGKIEAVKQSFLDAIDAKLESSDCVSDRMVDEFAMEVGQNLKPILMKIANGGEAPGVDFLKRQVNGLSLSRSGSSMFYISDSNDWLGDREKLASKLADKKNVRDLFMNLKDICNKKVLPDDCTELLKKVDSCIKEFDVASDNVLLDDVEAGDVFQELKELLENPKLAGLEDVQTLEKFKKAVDVLKGRLPAVESEIGRLVGEIADVMRWQEPFLQQENPDTLEMLSLKKEIKTLEARIRALGKESANAGNRREKDRIRSAIVKCQELLTSRRNKANAVADKMAADGKGVVVNRRELKAQMKKWFAAVVHANAKAALDSLFANCGTANDLRAVLERPGVYGFLSTFAGEGADGLFAGMINGKPDLYDAKMLGKYNFKSAISAMGDAVREWTDVVMATSVVEQTNKAVVLSLSEYMRIKATALQPWQSDSPDAQEILPASNPLNNEELHKDDDIKMLISGTAGQPQYDRVEKLPLENILCIACGKKGVALPLVAGWLKRYAPEFVSFKLKQLVHCHHLLKPLKRPLIISGTDVYAYDDLPADSAHLALEKVREALNSFTVDKLRMDYPEPGQTKVNFAENPGAHGKGKKLSEVEKEVGSERDAEDAKYQARRIEDAIKRLLRGTDVENVDEILLGPPGNIDRVFDN